MALPSSGAISFANFNTELGNTAGSQIDLEAAAVAFSINTRPHGMDEFYGLSIAPPDPTYSIVADRVLVNEGQYINFDVFTTNVSNGTVLYWQAIGEPGEEYTSPTGDDFEGYLTGTVTINSNTGSFGFQVFEDQDTEGEEVFVMRLRTGSAAGPIVATTDAIFIQDTSQDPPPPPPSESYYRMISCSGIVDDVQYYKLGSPLTTMYKTSRNEYFYWDGQSGSGISLGLFQPTLESTTFTSCAQTGGQL
jgi:hypothetical protein